MDTPDPPDNHNKNPRRNLPTKFNRQTGRHALTDTHAHLLIAMGLGLALRKPSFIPYWSAPPLNLRIEILLMDTRGDDIGIVILVAAVAVASTAHVLTSKAWGPIRFFISDF